MERECVYKKHVKKQVKDADNNIKTRFSFAWFVFLLLIFLSSSSSSCVSSSFPTSPPPSLAPSLFSLHPCFTSSLLTPLLPLLLLLLLLLLPLLLLSHPYSFFVSVRPPVPQHLRPFVCLIGILIPPPLPPSLPALPPSIPPSSSLLMYHPPYFKCNL